MTTIRFLLCFFLLGTAASVLRAADTNYFQPMDVFALEYAADPQISPDGQRVGYVRTSMDIQKDRRRTDLWIINTAGGDHRALTNGEGNHSMPRWSSDGKRIAYLSRHEGSTQLMCRWMEDGQAGRLAKLPAEVLGLSWSPDGKQTSPAVPAAACSAPGSSARPAAFAPLWSASRSSIGTASY